MDQMSWQQQRSNEQIQPVLSALVSVEAIIETVDYNEFTVYCIVLERYKWEW